LLRLRRNLLQLSSRGVAATATARTAAVIAAITTAIAAIRAVVVTAGAGIIVPGPRTLVRAGHAAGIYWSWSMIAGYWWRIRGCWWRIRGCWWRIFVFPAKRINYSLMEVDRSGYSLRQIGRAAAGAHFFCRRRWTWFLAVTRAVGILVFWCFLW